MAEIKWSFEGDELNAIRRIITEHAADPFVEKRHRENVKQPAPELTRTRVWEAHLAAQLTSQQRSGPDSAVTRFLRTSAALSLDRCYAADDVEDYVATTLSKFGGLRFHNTIGDALATNLQLLDADEKQGWTELESRLAALRELRRQEPAPMHASQERDVCRFIKDELGGEGLHRIGSKQSRNLLQMLGLTRYEIPLDSRITNWVNEHLEFPYHLTSGGLSQPAFYDFHIDAIQEACAEADVLPCIFDAAVFASYDSEWTEETMEGMLF